MLAGSKFLSGVMYDKLGLRFTVLFCDAASVITMLTLACVSGSSAGRGLAMVYGVFSSLALPLETIMLPIFANDLFGMRSYEHILGIFVSVNTAGYAVGVPLMNFVFDICGSYVPVLFILCGVMFAVTVIFQFVVSAANRRKAD